MTRVRGDEKGNRLPQVIWINPWDKRIGPNRYLADMLAADRALAECSVVALARDDAAAEEYRALGCAVEIWDEVALVHLSRTRQNIGRVLETHTRGVRFARARMRALGTRVVVTNSENVWFGGIAARSLGIPHLQVFHALTLEHHWGNRPQLVRGYLRWLGIWSARFIGVSQTVVEMLVRNGVERERVALVRNGLNLEAVRAASQQAMPKEIEGQLEGRAPILVTLGRISAMKGHDLLVETLARVKERFPNLLCLVGGGVLSAGGVEDTDAFFAMLEKRIMELNLERNVVFLGEIDYAPALLKRADVYVQPSRTESFCRAAVEALASGTAVAAFRAGALPEVLGKGARWAPPGDANALGEAIGCLIENEGVRAETLAAGQAQIRQFDAVNSAHALHGVLNEVLHGGIGRV